MEKLSYNISVNQIFVCLELMKNPTSLTLPATKAAYLISYDGRKCQKKLPTHNATQTAENVRSYLPTMQRAVAIFLFIRVGRIVLYHFPSHGHSECLRRL